MIAKKIERIVKTKALHVLYSNNGKWYNHLKDFPGVLFDSNGYVTFNRKTEYEHNIYLQHGIELNVSCGISQMPGYKKFSEDEKKQVLEIL